MAQETKTRSDIAQLHRVIGQLRGIEKLLYKKEKPQAVLQQLEAARGGLLALEKELLKTSIASITDKDVRAAVSYIYKVS